MKFSIISHFLLIANLHLLSKTEANKIHHSLNSEELKQLFSVESHTEVPEYEVVKIHSRSRRSTDGAHTRAVRINAFGKEKTLLLKPNEGLIRDVPVFFADPPKKGSGVVLTPMPQENIDIGTPYQDELSQAAVMVSHDPHTGDLLLEGTIGDDLVLRPLPPSLKPLVRPKSSGSEDETSENVLPESDDEIFMDEEAVEEDLVFSDGLPLVVDDAPTQKEDPVPSEAYRNKTDKSDLPQKQRLLRRRRSTSMSQGLHVIYKRTPPAIDTDYALMELDKIPLRAPKARSKRSKREAPYVIYPEILVLVDYDGYLLHGQDNSKIKSYYVSFWNGVDLRYKLLKNPRVKVSIAGIIISRGRDAMPYMERNRVGRDAIDSASALTDMGKYLYQERRLPTYDIAVAITKLDMCRRGHKGGKCNRGTAGFAYVGGACVVNKRLKKVNSVAIVEDTGGFSGIIVAAHEVGHLLGAVHDGSPPPSYLGGPGAKHCRWKDGFIMSDLRHTERGFRWSPCSIEQFHHFLNGETATCLYNLPHEDESLPRVLPGKLLSLDAQCKKDRGTTACFKDERVCSQLFCFDSESGFCVSYRPAAEGSDCGSGKICLNGRCVFDNENSISDVDIHRPDDKSLSDSTTPKANSIQSTVRTTTPSALTTTKRSYWWENNNRWKKNKTTTTRRPYTSKYKSTNRWQYTTTKYSSKTTTLRPITTTRPPTTRWPNAKRQDDTHTTPRPSPWNKYKTTKRWSSITTTRTKTTPSPFISTTTQRNHFTTKSTPLKFTKTVPTTTSRYTKENEAPKPINSINDDSNGACVDKLTGENDNLSCPDFLNKYGYRYCNHRYIEKNCCKSKQELCSTE